MTLPREPLFLARQNYRRRRIADAARGLPVFGAVLFLLPLLSAGQGRNDTVGWLAYVFLIWLVLIVVAALLSRGVARTPDEGEMPGAETGTAPRKEAPR